MPRFESWRAYFPVACTPRPEVSEDRLSDTLAPLQHLQDLDLELESLLGAGTEGSRKVAELEAAAQRARADADAERGRLADTERLRRQLETQMAEDKDKLKKWEARLPALKTPREFAALQREVDGLRKSVAAAEEQLGTTKVTADEVKQAVQAKEAELARREAAIKSAIAEMRGADKDRVARIEELRGLREKARKLCEPRLLASYENIKKKRPGKALAQLNGYICGGCNRKMAPQLAHKVLNGHAESCPNCLRLLYAPPEPAQPPA